MKIIDFEKLILLEIKQVVEKIVKENLTLPIPVKSRAGAEISDFLEDEFVLRTQDHKYFKDSQYSPKGATKNPWDVSTYFTIKNHKELLWIDFKAVKISGLDSNPDIGTPDKIIRLIESGYFYLVYVFVYYEQFENGLRFVKRENDEYVKIYFLKDISQTFRRNPKNQFQVNVLAKPEYRSREEFVKLFIKKIMESHIRQMQISERVLKKIKDDQIEEKLILLNRKSEEKIKKI